MQIFGWKKNASAHLLPDSFSRIWHFGAKWITDKGRTLFFPPRQGKIFDIYDFYDEMVKKHKFYVKDQEMPGDDGYNTGFANNSLTYMDGPCIQKQQDFQVFACILQ